jgi:hypothetical protein
MRSAKPWIVPVFLSLLQGVAAGQPANISGSWHLNVEKSRWGSTPKPVSVTLEIRHSEPQLQYQGSVMYANEDRRDFGFFGAIDGKPYAMSRSFGSGNIILNRVDPFTVDSVFRTTDGYYVETARTSVSKDGKAMTRALRLKSPEGTTSWTEIYEKR